MRELINPSRAKWPFSKRTTPHLFRHLHCFATSLPEYLSTLRNALIIAPRTGVPALDKAANSYRQFLKAALSFLSRRVLVMPNPKECRDHAF
jgi:hypothetical protein